VVVMGGHSFDNILGALPQSGASSVDGLTFGQGDLVENTNPAVLSGDPPVAAFPLTATAAPTQVTETWNASRDQVNGGAMDGFVRTAGSAEPMGFYPGDVLPFTHSLASTFTVANRWFASMPGPAYPNRRFLLAGTAYGATATSAESLTHRPPPNGTIFDQLSNHRITWCDYFTDVPFSLVIPSIVLKHPDHHHPIARFFQDCRAGTLPAVSFVDPGIGALPSLSADAASLPSVITEVLAVLGVDLENIAPGSQEGANDVYYHEAWLASVIQAILASPAWQRTLLIYTHDSHGGYYDHVPPPPALPPDDIPARLSPGDYPGGYDAYGVRVPAVVVSPYSRPGAALEWVFDHTSVLATIEAKWNLPALTRRDANASTVMQLLDVFGKPILDPPSLAPSATSAGPPPGTSPGSRTVPPDPPSPLPVRPIELGTLGGASNDTVTDRDELGFQGYVDAFVELFTSPHTEPPLTIGIYGPWGMGKSFLLRNIESGIRDRLAVPVTVRGDVVDVHVFLFSAWSYFATEPVLPSMVRAIAKDLDETLTGPWYRRRWHRVSLTIRSQVRRLWRPLTAAAVLAVGSVAVGILGHRPGAGAAIGAAIVAAGAGVLVKSSSESLEGWVADLFSERERQPSLEDLKKDLMNLERRLRPDNHSNEQRHRRVLIMIDDLDRCEPDKVVETLQAVNKLLDIPNFIVGLGIDARVVTSAVEKHYDGLLEEAGASGYEYLDKIVQIPFRIPEPNENEIREFIRTRLGSPAPRVDENALYANGDQDARSTQLPGPPPEPSPDQSSEEPTPRPTSPTDRYIPGGVQAEGAYPFTYDELRAFQELSPFLRRNPRHLKRVINVYRLVRWLAQAKTPVAEQVILQNPDRTIAWLVMWSQWPYSAQLMLRRYRDLSRQADARNMNVSAPMLYLFDAVGEELNRALSIQFDDDRARLRELLDHGLSGLAWPEIATMQRYTVNFNPAVEDKLRLMRDAELAAGAVVAPPTRLANSDPQRSPDEVELNRQ